MHDFFVVEKLQDQVEAGAEQIKLLRADQRHEVDNVFLVLQIAHEVHNHVFELGQAVLQNLELL